MSQENPIIVSAGEWINANRRLHISWNMQPFWEWPKSLSWMAIAVAMEMTADHLEPIVQDALLRTGIDIERLPLPTESTYGLDINIYLPEAIRQAAAAVRNQHPDMIFLFARQMVGSFRALVDVVGMGLPPRDPLIFLHSSHGFRRLAQNLSRRKSFDYNTAWELASNWVQWMDYLLLISMHALPPTDLWLSGPLQASSYPYYYLAVTEEHCRKSTIHFCRWLVTLLKSGGSGSKTHYLGGTP